MKLNLKIISDQLTSFVISDDFSSWQTALKIEYPEQGFPSEALSENIVYLCESKKLPAVPPALSAQEVISLICLGLPPRPYYTEQFEILTLSENLHPAEVMNALTKIFYHFQYLEWQLTACAYEPDALTRSMEIGLQIFGNPVLIYNQQDEPLYIAFDPDRSENRGFYMAIRNHTYPVMEERSILLMNAEFRKSYETQGPSYLRTDYSSTQAIYENLFINDTQYLGRIFIENNYHPFHDSDYALIAWFGKYIKDLLIRAKKFHSPVSRDFETMMYAMLVQSRSFSGQFEKTLKENGWEKSHVFRCVSIIPMNESEDTVDFNQDAYYLQELLDSQYLMIFENQIFQVINITQSSLSQHEIDRRLILFMKCNCPYLMGISKDFQDFSQLSMHMAQARTAAHYAAQKDANPICYYEKDLLSILLGQAMNTHGIEFYYTKGIERLIRYDQENHTELLDTLFCYLKNMCNVTAATEEMHIGRTTCLYRLKRAQELSHLSLQDEDERIYLMILSHFLKHPSTVISP